MLDRVRERIHPQEFIEARAEIESKPLPAKLRVGVRTPRPPLPLGAPARSVAAMAGIRAEAPVDLRTLGLRIPSGPVAPPRLTSPTPIVLTDWSARLAADFGAVDSALGWLASNTQRCIEQAANVELYAVRWLFAALADFAAETDDDRGAMLAGVNAERVLIDELALYGAKAQVA